MTKPSVRPLPKYFFVIIFLFFAHGCNSLQQLANIQKPDISFADMKISELTLQDVELLFDLKVDNPNPLAIKLSGYEYDFFVNEASFVKGQQSLSTQIEASGESIIQVPVRMTYGELLDTFNSLRSKDETGYTFKANVNVDAPVLGLINIPVEKTGTFPVIKMPKISIGDLLVKNLSFTKADLELQLNVENPNGFDLLLNALNYDVIINGLTSLSGSTEETVTVNKKGEGSIKIPLSLNILQLGMSAYNILKGDEPLEYSLNGDANIGADLPLFESSTFNFNRSGQVDLNN